MATLNQRITALEQQHGKTHNKSVRIDTESYKHAVEQLKLIGFPIGWADHLDITQMTIEQMRIIASIKIDEE